MEFCQPHRTPDASKKIGFCHKIRKKIQIPDHGSLLLRVAQNEENKHFEKESLARVHNFWCPFG